MMTGDTGLGKRGVGAGIGLALSDRALPRRRCDFSATACRELRFFDMVNT